MMFYVPILHERAILFWCRCAGSNGPKKQIKTTSAIVGEFKGPLVFFFLLQVFFSSKDVFRQCEIFQNFRKKSLLAYSKDFNSEP